MSEWESEYIRLEDCDPSREARITGVAGVRRARADGRQQVGRGLMGASRWGENTPELDLPPKRLTPMARVSCASRERAPSDIPAG